MSGNGIRHFLDLIDIPRKQLREMIEKSRVMKKGRRGAAGKGPLWAQVSYTAGWAGTDEDPYPADLVEVVIWWASWLYRSKDAPSEKTANQMTGTVIIPGAMPPRLRQAVERWKATWAV